MSSACAAVAALNASGSAARFSYISTAGGAFLEWLLEVRAEPRRHALHAGDGTGELLVDMHTVETTLVGHRKKYRRFVGTDLDITVSRFTRRFYKLELGFLIDAL